MKVKISQVILKYVFRCHALVHHCRDRIGVLQLCLEDLDGLLSYIGHHLYDEAACVFYFAVRIYHDPEADS